jgi:Leucine-rich repeat (LRR) protein
MKNFMLIILLFANISLNAQSTYVPDDNFEQALIDLGYDSGTLDDYVMTSNISEITSLDISSKSINSLTGIEDFTALTYLNCYNNELTSLDVSANTALTNLLCNVNQLTSLDVSANMALTYLMCGGNQLISLDVSEHTALFWLSCFSNQLTSLDVSANTALTVLDCYDNQLISLDISSNMALNTLDCSVNQLSSLDVSANTGLDILGCAFNNLISIDVSANTALTKLNCVSNHLTSLDLRNGNNANVTTFDVSDNPDLTCIYVDDKTASYLSDWNKDVTASFVESETECTALSVYELTENTDFSICPNPVKEQFSIQTNKEIEKIKVYNVVGKLVKAYNQQDIYSVFELKRGVYFINIHCTSEIFTQKIIIE